MKKLLYFIVAVAAITFGSSCEDNFKGVNHIVEYCRLQVFRDGEMVFDDTNANWTFEKQDDGTYTLYMNETRFVEAMPMLDMEVRGMENDSASSDDAFNFAAAAIVPYYAGVEYPRYTLTDFSCKVSADGNNMEVGFNCAGYVVVYTKTIEYVLYE